MNWGGISRPLKPLEHCIAYIPLSHVNRELVRFSYEASDNKYFKVCGDGVMS